MIDRSYYEGYNVNDYHEVRKEVIALLDELQEFDKRIKKFLGPKKVKVAATDARRSCKKIKNHLDKIKKKIQMNREDYNSDYEND